MAFHHQERRHNIQTLQSLLTIDVDDDDDYDKAYYAKTQHDMRIVLTLKAHKYSKNVKTYK